MASGQLTYGNSGQFVSEVIVGHPAGVWRAGELVSMGENPHVWCQKGYEEPIERNSFPSGWHFSLLTPTHFSEHIAYFPGSSDTVIMKTSHQGYQQLLFD